MQAPKGPLLSRDLFEVPRAQDTPTRTPDPDTPTPKRQGKTPVRETPTRFGGAPRHRWLEIPAQPLARDAAPSREPDLTVRH